MSMFIVGNFYENYGVYQGKVIHLGVPYHKFQRHALLRLMYQRKKMKQ